MLTNNLELNIREDLKSYISRRTDVPAMPVPEALRLGNDGPGVCYRFDFPNGYGASVIKSFGSYGWEQDLWELACLHHGDICYNDDFFDVEGYLSDDEVETELQFIFNYEKEEHND